MTKGAAKAAPFSFLLPRNPKRLDIWYNPDMTTKPEDRAPPPDSPGTDRQIPSAAELLLARAEARTILTAEQIASVRDALRQVDAGLFATDEEVTAAFSMRA